jgi:hypothetical protein
MLLFEYLKMHPVKARRMKRATGCRCENCSNAFPLHALEIHPVGSLPDINAPGRDLQKHLLVLCPTCGRSFRAGQVKESLQRELVRHRSHEIRNKMREILEYHPREYIPPGDFDPGEVFQEMLDSGALDLCLNGG